ncbi:ATP-dependent DNA helicase PIF1 [Penicillium angulare]|uniref:ATP-dependent DNA helicase PIF1 n=1 Tax=Penicillium angulare TaxID=116970 RepID=UPI0025404D68|nr:ATP-dependent DNA helicase PIF1 [Penicillium angulare]KAJ5279645.1 ATP-dependent DNA helicase PIF1 [Penicillium angulare]
MFKKAVDVHPGGTTSKPLQSNLLRANTSISSNKPSLPPQSVGIKRKIEMTNGGESSLGSLHSTVYFDENDFDDDIDLDDIDEPIPFIAPKPANAKAEPVTYPIIDLTSSNNNRPPTDVKYPDLPAISQDHAPPSSSIQIPWSSSPPSHFQPPPKPRSLPWLKESKDEPREDTKKSFITPKRSKPTPLWNKSASAIKEEQKELRRESKKTSKEAMQGAVYPQSSGNKPPVIALSDEQKAVLDSVVDRGKSIFFTGSAGTGKSVLMREIIKKLRIKYKREPDRVAVTASTGLAACNIEGVTLHSFAGIGLGKEAVPELVKKIKKNQKARNRWLRTKVLVVDEVSMVDGDLFDKLEEIARRIRNNGRPFGGIQLVVTGDFFQLPPVPEGGREAKFAFSAATWNTTIQHTILLTHVFRQRDPEFAAMLNEMRLGQISPSTIEAFRKLSRPLNFHDELDATELFPTRNEVENANSARMSRLSGEMMTFKAVDSGTITDQQYREKLLSNCMAPPLINLKKGAQVMLIKNMEDTLVNGSIGRVVAFMDEAKFDWYRTNEGEVQANEDGEMSDEDSVSRARQKLKAMVHKEDGAPGGRKWPLVCFVQPDGTERHLLCQPEAWKIELPNGEIQAQRQQVPLILAWALSIHKAQGQTLQRVKVDLGRVFEKGQAYVALSRATSQEGLQVSRFEPRKVMVHHKVIDFYKKLVSIDDVLGPRKKAKVSNPSKPADDFEDDCFDAI